MRKPDLCGCGESVCYRAALEAIVTWGTGWVRLVAAAALAKYPRKGRKKRRGKP